MEGGLSELFEASFNERYINKETNNEDTLFGKKYFQMDPDFIEKGKRFIENYINGENKTKWKDKKQPSSNIGFIPLELTLDIAGMSGMKIYNQLLIDTRFLPPNYGNTLEFVVMGLNHKVDSSGWTTSINAISKPKDDGESPTPPKIQGPLQEPNSTPGFNTFGQISNNT